LGREFSDAQQPKFPPSFNVASSMTQAAVNLVPGVGCPMGPIAPGGGL
jgi:hypothetical protein